MTLKLSRAEHHYQCGGRLIFCRTIHPRRRYGARPGNKVVIREWREQTAKSGVLLPKVTDPARLLELEQALGEWPDCRVIQHPTLGNVTTPAQNSPQTLQDALQNA